MLRARRSPREPSKEPTGPGGNVDQTIVRSRTRELDRGLERARLERELQVVEPGRSAPNTSGNVRRAVLAHVWAGGRPGGPASRAIRTVRRTCSRRMQMATASVILLLRRDAFVIVSSLTRYADSNRRVSRWVEAAPDESRA